MAVIIHGDIKPQNILIFEDHEHKLVAKIADFGNSVAGVAENDLCQLPRSDPWTAPEYHHRKFSVSAAKKMDIYSFSMLCLWLLLDEKQGVVDAKSSMKVFQELKETSSFRDQLKEIVEPLNLENQRAQKLLFLFETSLSRNPEDRVFSMQDLAASLNSDPYVCILHILVLGLLSQERPDHNLSRKVRTSRDVPCRL
jgi:serine/threonine protein kinase